ncbi:MAG: pilus motility taxis protein HmpF, partial [Snowella sp.]
NLTPLTGLQLVLYLAEVKKQTRTFLGSLRTDLRLLACQHSDQTWSAIPNEEVLTTEELDITGEGTLWVLQLTNNRQFQGKPDLAAPELVRQLQKLSRLSEKFKEQQGEIEQWKESLTYQSQELARREAEIDARESDIEDKSLELAQVNRQQQEVNLAWERLETERQQLLALQERFGNILNLSPEQTHQLQLLINRFAIHPDRINALLPVLQTMAESAQHQQDIFNRYWQDLEKNKTKAGQIHQEIQQKGEILDLRRQELESVRSSLESAKIQFAVEKNVLSNKQDFLGRLNSEIASKGELQKTLYRLATGSAETANESKIDPAALEVMPLSELEETIKHLQSDLERLVRFVNDQEEELTLQCQSVEELQAKLSQVSEFDRIAIEEELGEEQERKRMLDETLVGQRRNLKERQTILVQHLQILRRRQGIIDLEANYSATDLDPVIEQLDSLQHETQAEKLKLETDIHNLQENLQQIQDMIDQLDREQQAKSKDIQQEENAWRQLQQDVMQIETKIRIYETTLQPLQNQLDVIRPQTAELCEWFAS